MDCTTIDAWSVMLGAMGGYPFLGQSPIFNGDELGIEQDVSQVGATGRKTNSNFSGTKTAMGLQSE